MKVSINVLGYLDGFYQVKIIRPLSDISRREFTLDRLKEEIEQARDYCTHKGYEFELKGIDMDELYQSV